MNRIAPYLVSFTTHFIVVVEIGLAHCSKIDYFVLFPHLDHEYDCKGLKNIQTRELIVPFVG